MTAQNTTLAMPPGEVYLQQLALLREEMATAMLGISGNSLSVLEESLWKQQVLCVSLKRLLQMLQGAQIDSDCMARIRSATSALHSLNQTYEELVKQARSHTEVLYGLCVSYSNGSPQEDASGRGRLCSLKA